MQRQLDSHDLNKSKEEILVALEEQKKHIHAIRPPDPSLKASYEEAIAHLTKMRGQPLFHPYIGNGRGNGVFVELMDGSVKLDFISGIGSYFGHLHPRMVKAALNSALQNVWIETNIQQNAQALELMAMLTQASGLEHCFLTTSGTMANENALKILLQKKAPASRLLAFERCFMGRSLAMLQLTDKPELREGLPRTLHVDYLPFYDEREPQKSKERTLNCLERFIRRYPNDYACMCFELIQGEGGSYPGSAPFFSAIMRLLKKHNIAIFVDEVQTFGRTDSLFAFHHFGLQDYVDVVTCGKMLEACATLFSPEFKPKPNLLSQTFVASSSAVHIGIEVIKCLTEEGFLGPNGKNVQLGQYFTQRLNLLAEKYPDRLEGPFGYGLMLACTPFKGEKEKVIACAKALFEEGLITLIAGSLPTRLRFLLPAGSMTYEHIDEGLDIFERVLARL